MHLCVDTMIVNRLVEYAKDHSVTGMCTAVGNVSAKEKEPFYEKIAVNPMVSKRWRWC